MANDTIPMGDMFKVCSAILDRRLTPLHYRQLTELALRQLGVNNSFVNMDRQIEDVREKMLCTGRCNSIYFPSPFCLAAKKNWFQGLQEPLLISPDDEAITIPGHAKRGADGAFETVMRDSEMIQKNPHASIEQVRRARAKGLVLEKHVAGWFEENWPTFYLPPDNHRVWSRPCDHDFKLRINGTTWKVDVFGRNSRGKFINPGHGKRRVHLHLACEIIDKDVAWRAIFTGKDYDGELKPELGISPRRLVVWLNCQKYGLDHVALSHYTKYKEYSDR